MRIRKYVGSAIALTLSCAFALVLLEFSVRLLVRHKVVWVPAPAPAPPAIFDPEHPVFGAWHTPGATGFLRTPSFSVRYDINSVGARDVERSRDAVGSRVVVLGDSVTEGWGVEVEDRLSNLLEASSGQEHLNFSMAHFSPYQSYLVYRDLASEFDHDSVILGVFPYNDFTDLDYQAAAHAPGYEYRYRPYLVGSYPDYRHLDYREQAWQRFLRRRSYAYGALDLLLSKLRGHAIWGYYREWRDEESKLFRSFYYDHSEADLRLLQHVVKLLVREAREKRVAVVLFPALQDIRRYRQSGPSRLAASLHRAGGGELRVVDLLPHMATRQETDPKRMFISVEHSDFHLSKRGNAIAARVLLHELNDFYDSATQ